MKDQVAGRNHALPSSSRLLQLPLQPGQLRRRQPAAKLDKPGGSRGARSEGVPSQTCMQGGSAWHQPVPCHALSCHAMPCHDMGAHLRCGPTRPAPLFLSSLGLLASSKARACSCCGWPAANGGVGNPIPC